MLGAVGVKIRPVVESCVNVRDFGAIGDGISHPLSKRYSDLAAAQADFPHATSLDQEIDCAAIQAAIDAAKVNGGTICFPPGTYIVGSTVGGPGSAALTIPANGIRLLGSGSGSTVIKAKDYCDFESMIYAGSKTGVQIVDLAVDSNQANRSKQLTTRTIGINFASCVESKVSRCVIKNNIGATPGQDASLPGVGISYSFTTRCVIESCIIEDSGVCEKTADGCYTSGTQNLIIGCTARNCLDTAFVLEASNQSGIIGCTAVGCSAGAGITNFISEDCRGNFINGLTVYDWNAKTGGISFGVLAGGTGNLVNTQISNVLLERKDGTGPALNVRQPVTKGVWNNTIAYSKGDTVTYAGIGYVALQNNTNSQPPSASWASIGKTIGLTLQGIQIKGATTQGIALAGAEQVLVTDCHIIDTQAAGIQIQPGCSKVLVSNNYLATQASSSIAVNYRAPNSQDSGATVDDVTINNNVIVGDSSKTGNGIYFFNTCHRATALWNTITNMTIARVGSDLGTTPTVIDAFSP